MYAYIDEIDSDQTEDLGRTLLNARAFNFIRTSVYPEFERLVTELLPQIQTTNKRIYEQDRKIINNRAGKGLYWFLLLCVWKCDLKINRVLA